MASLDPVYDCIGASREKIRKIRYTHTKLKWYNLKTIMRKYENGDEWVQILPRKQCIYSSMHTYKKTITYNEFPRKWLLGLNHTYISVNRVLHYKTHANWQSRICIYLTCYQWYKIKWTNNAPYNINTKSIMIWIIMKSIWKLKYIAGIMLNVCIY